MLTGFSHLTLASRDLPRSIDFYGDLLGFQRVAVWETGAYLELGSLWLCLTADASAEIAAGYTHYAFSIGELEFPAFRSRLLAHGVQEWKQNSSEGDSFYFLDPDGHRLEAHVGTLGSRIAACRAKPYRDMVFFD
jgi:glutathione S-transferase fosA